MNKVILMGRLTRDPDIRQSQGESSTVVSRYTLAVDRRFKRDGADQTADFISCVAFGKTAEFMEKYTHKGTKLVVSGRIQTGSYTNKDGQKVYTTDVVTEDVEFADRKQFAELLNEIEKELTTLLQSFQMGNAIKKGISVAIVGKPNVGKSTLLNALLKEDRAIVSDISGTTRDTIEDTIQLNGFLFRFVDTAGIRKNADTIEKMGIERSFDALNKAMAVLWVADQWSQTSLLEQYQELFAHVDMTNKKKFLLLNKIDTHANQNTDFTFLDFTTLPISAKNNININRLEEHLANYAQSCYSIHEVMISNLRHYHAFEKALHALQQAKEGFENGFSNDLIAVDIRQTLHFLAEVVGQVSNEDILSEIFSNFCIGK
mgnify:CR=1 FL=1